MSTKKNTSGTTTEVRIGISESSQELHIESDLTPEQVIAAVTAALDSGKSLSLTDTRGRQTIIGNNKISFVEVGQSAERKVGFASA
ncbi:unannotated protein [freshwater metagenome]|jgi:hypothetical protein|uniref:Unannotated protein n=1 Tax=freshwater metagenome TaxID=449393 RepID=A0A6J6TWN9_9ZZZZ|nr:DUF3107 family protein [Actinomycetota bacterium]